MSRSDHHHHHHLELPQAVVAFLKSMAKSINSYKLSWDLCGFENDQITLRLTWKIADVVPKTDANPISLSITPRPRNRLGNSSSSCLQFEEDSDSRLHDRHAPSSCQAVEKATQTHQDMISICSGPPQLTHKMDHQVKDIPWKPFTVPMIAQSHINNISATLQCDPAIDQCLAMREQNTTGTANIGTVLKPSTEKSSDKGKTNERMALSRSKTTLTDQHDEKTKSPWILRHVTGSNNR